MKTFWSWQFNLKTASESNSSEHWTAKHKRHKKQKLALAKVFMVERPKVQPPCKVTLTRIAPKALDAHDNLAVSLKWISDAVADYLVPGKASGRADDCKAIEWAFKQEKRGVREYGVFIEIETL